METHDLRLNDVKKEIINQSENLLKLYLYEELPQ